MVSPGRGSRSAYACLEHVPWSRAHLRQQVALHRAAVERDLGVWQGDGVGHDGGCDGVHKLLGRLGQPCATFGGLLGPEASAAAVAAVASAAVASAAVASAAAVSAAGTSAVAGQLRAEPWPHGFCNGCVQVEGNGLS